MYSYQLLLSPVNLSYNITRFNWLLLLKLAKRHVGTTVMSRLVENADEGT